MNETLLSISDLRVYFHSVRGEYKVVDGVNLTVNRNEILGLAGESGCGKSTVIEAVMRLIRPPGYIQAGEIMFRPEGEPAVDLLELDERSLEQIRWKYISYVPQASMNSLNPIMRIETQIADVMKAHSTLTKPEIHERATQVLDIVGLPARVLDAYPHELSGGMKQRAIIAIAMTLSPQLVIADEPTTALDVNVQRAILEAILNIKEETGTTVLFVSHDLAVHAELVDRLAIMYAGKIVEVDTVYNLFKQQTHPYSQRLFSSIPVLGGSRVRQESILGQAPDRLNWPSGCRFHPRCPFAMDKCSQIEPPLVEIETGHHVACHLAYDVATSEIILPTKEGQHEKPA
ncbi:MAG: ABC transporter ATP-binding protein [Anaerolineae bacterium]|nr:ABC transporter ATP-binding protein [Anaerolineae bacterium]